VRCRPAADSENLSGHPLHATFPIKKITMSASGALPKTSCRVLLADSTLMSCELLAKALGRHAGFDVVVCGEPYDLPALLAVSNPNVAC
jgi:hypothetical protein